jgi:Holliday junction resolvase RusA-like endonuclease
MIELCLEIPGRPITKKNHGQVKVRGGRRYHVQSDAFYEYEQMALIWLLQWGNQYIPGEVEVTCLYWLPNKRGWPDLIGLLQGTSDILQKAGFIENDKNIISYDGSRIIGIDKENPRCEIKIRKI